MSTEPASVLAQPAVGNVCAFIVERAKKHFRDAENIMARNPRRVVRAPRIMGLAYKAILDNLVARGFAPPRKKVRTPRARLLWIVLRNLV
jgi:presqualene diphosphate synthase